MEDFIPLVIAPYPDELLYSWVKRLADLNELSIEVFFRKYFGDCLAKGQYIPLDIRRGYFNFCDALNCDVDKMELYFQLSTAQFELMFYPEKQQVRIINHIVRPESKLNIISQYFIKEPKVCKECMQEDVEKYGEFYIHRSHQLSGVCSCHKHHTRLYTVKKYFRKRDCKHLYDYDNLVEVKDTITEYDIKYSEYAYQLLQSKIDSNSNIILSTIFEKVKSEFKDENFGRKIFSQTMGDVLGDPSKINKWSRLEVIIPPEDTIKILLKYFPDVNDFTNKLKQYDLVIKQHCEKCGNDYYITQHAIDNGWGCTHCDHLLGEQKLFKRIVQVGGNKEYKMKGQFEGSGQKVTLFHKTCGEDFLVEPGDFIFRHTRCKCNQRLLRKDAEKRVKPYSHFKLIKFNGMSQSATFYHDVCDQEFELFEFKDFLETPKCRCCEMVPDMTTELFKQRVKEIVGDEYEVLGEANRREDRIDILHKQCGRITNFKVYEFLEGSRCPHCYCKTSDDRLAAMLKEYADNRYTIIGHDKYRFIIYDNEEGREIRLRGKHVIQEMLRPTPSPILPTHKDSIEKSMTTWDAWYQLCVEFKREFGHLAVSRDQKYKDKLLGDWCSMQRILRNKGELSEDRIQLLEYIGFVFDMVFYYWNERFEEYKDYVRETGDMNPREDVMHNGNKVGRWVRSQRHENARGKLNPVYKAILLEFNPDIFKDRRPPKRK